MDTGMKIFGINRETGETKQIKAEAAVALLEAAYAIEEQIAALEAANRENRALIQEHMKKHDLSNVVFAQRDVQGTFVGFQGRYQLTPDTEYNSFNRKAFDAAYPGLYEQFVSKSSRSGTFKFDMTEPKRKKPQTE